MKHYVDSCTACIMKDAKIELLRQELNEYNHKIEEYWREDEQAYYMSDWQISYRQKWDPEFGNRGFPVLSLLWGDFILSGDIFHLDRRE